MKKVNRVMIFFLLCCLLSGCAGLLKSEYMDEQVESVIRALNEEDADRIYQMLYPGVTTREEFDKSYEDILKIWEKSDDYTMKLKAVNTHKTHDGSGESLIRRAQYYVYTKNHTYTVTLTHLTDDKGEGVYQFHMNEGAEPVLISGSFATAGANSALQWGLLSVSVLSYIFVIVTAVDIFRKRPRLYGVWLGAALTFGSFQIQAMPGNLHMNVGVNWFVLSAFRIYSGGGRSFLLALPVGAIVYWCMRKKLCSSKLQNPGRG